MDKREYREEKRDQKRFSILIPTWNNLPFVQLCVRSLRDHSTVPHQIILHINDGTDGTRDWAIAENIEHSWSPENIGICKALNEAATLATTDYICFFNDDMYALPGWDAPMLELIRLLPNHQWFLSGTMIEPTDTGNPCVIAPKDYGRSLEDFREQELLAHFQSWKMDDWNGATWPPNVVHKSLWDAVGGYSEEFSPGMSSDPDFSRKLWEQGVRYFRGLGESRVYHFQARSTGKITKNNGRRQFLKKWKLTQSTFTKYYLQRGKKWNGAPVQIAVRPGLLFGHIKSFFKRLF